MARWTVRLGETAARDFSGIIAFTAETFGAQQAKIYQTTLTKALTALHAGPSILGSIARDEIAPGLRSLHVARKGRRGRHVILYRTASPPTKQPIIEVIRILHDAMDLAGHVPKR
jgi:toxin ParE1/3/4